ncbi:glycosyltransferase family 2 protein [Chachezhania antarctica]|uniref:glycosyltransferase family 2 protein n=1 Tax=Chachezhania antarctica TaxID=2340860 RepID=UPI000EB4AA00|nr:glycosyltransferase family 2 protein [Chachezhania antarctica]|tara:strand:- start:8331 stop:9263 length:933 start_codon:yes stop_codon:yes gene_type:complete
MKPVVDRTSAIEPGAILLFACVRNEAVRLPYFLSHYRKLGVDHFLIVDNGSDDGTVEQLRAAPDVSLWQTTASYKKARFGIDWLTWLMLRHGHDHWCLTVDADELLIYPHHDTRPLPALTDWLDRSGVPSFGAMMLDLYPKGRLGDAHYEPGQNPVEVMPWFDRGNYTIRLQPRHGNLWIQGGVRARVFFDTSPRRAPTLNKIPLVRWNRRYCYVTSTHYVLPYALNTVYATDGGEATSGILLHTKFLDTIVEKSKEEKSRREHFENSDLYETYYDRLIANPTLWCAQSSRFVSWRQLEGMGLMSRGGWT